MKSKNVGQVLPDGKEYKAAVLDTTPSPALRASSPARGEEEQLGFTSPLAREVRRSRDEGVIARGFTLIELLVVVLIIGILAAVALPQYQKAVEKSRNMQALITGKAFLEAQQLYHLANGRYATSMEELDIVSTTLDGWRISMRYSDGHLYLKSDKNNWDFYPETGLVYCFAPLDRSDTEMLLRVCQFLTGDANCTKQQNNGRWACTKYF